LSEEILVKPVLKPPRYPHGEFQQPTALWESPTGDVFVVDSGNNQIMKINHERTVNFAGNGMKPSLIVPFESKNAREVAIHTVSGISGDSEGNIYFSSCESNQIFLVNSNHTLTLVAGGYRGKKGSTSDGNVARGNVLSCPSSVFVDKNNIVYFVENENCRVRWIDSGNLKTFAGNGHCGNPSYDSKAVDSMLNNPSHLFVNDIGDIFITESSLNEVLKIEKSSGEVLRFACNSKERAPQSSYYLDHPLGITGDKYGNIYVSSLRNSLILNISKSGLFTNTYPAQARSLFYDETQLLFFSTTEKDANVHYWKRENKPISFSRPDLNAYDSYYVGAGNTVSFYMCGNNKLNLQYQTSYTDVGTCRIVTSLRCC
jgi:hypothetical protein